MRSSENERQGALKVYEALKNDLGEGVRISQGMIKKEYKEDGWTYTFFIDNGNLLKLEASNHRELIEVWM